MRRCGVCVETPASRTQVFVDDYGDLAVNNNVVFKENTANSYGGAVSLPFNCTSHPSGLGYFER